MLRVQQSGIAAFTGAVTSVSIHTVASANTFQLDYLDLFTTNALASPLTVTLQNAGGIVIATLGVGRTSLNVPFKVPYIVSASDVLSLVQNGTSVFNVSWALGGYAA
jgi:hypothetical protein